MVTCFFRTSLIKGRSISATRSFSCTGDAATMRSNNSASSSMLVNVAVSGIGSSLRFIQLALQFFQLLRIAHGREQQTIEFVVPLQRSPQIAQVAPELQKLIERRHLARHLLRFEVLEL